MKDYFLRLNIFFYFSIILGFISCQNGKKEQSISSASDSHFSTEKQHFEFVEPINGSFIKYNLPVTINIKFSDSTDLADSVKIYIDSKYYKTLTGKKHVIRWKETSLQVGQKRISADVFFHGGKQESSAIVINLVSDVAPVKYSYKILKTYPHNVKAFTQGLVYENGYLYESDGEYGQSSLRKQKLPSCEVIKDISLDSKFFAEGIALIGKEIYQVTWREQTCFVYDKETFKVLRKYNYDIAEGWGLAWDGNKILMTDGSNDVYFIDKNNFKQVGKIEVMDDKGPVDKLNELEYVKNRLFANIWQKDIIVVIDPNTGKVIGELNFAGLLKEEDKTQETDVLNGIAWNPSNNHFYITGKNWPKLFEIEIINFE